jgi:hypothetical protein
MFLNELTNGVSYHLTDLITTMRRCVSNHYSASEVAQIGSDSQPKVLTLADLKRTDYFSRVQKLIKKHQTEINLS